MACKKTPEDADKDWYDPLLMEKCLDSLMVDTPRSKDTGILRTE
jgi:hypothetical protein